MDKTEKKLRHEKWLAEGGRKGMEERRAQRRERQLKKI
jgi:hypothetical protein